MSESTSTTNTDTKVVFTAEGDVAGTTPGNLDYKALYEGQAAKTAQLEAVIAAGRLQSSTAKGDDRKPAVTAQRLKAMLGPVGWLNSTRDEKLVGLGLNPREVDDNLLKKLFGRGNDGKAAQDLHKQNPYRYRVLKEASEALDVYGM